MADFYKTTTEDYVIDKRTGMVINMNKQDELNMKKERQYRKEIRELKNTVEYLVNELAKIKTHIGIT